MPPLKMPKSELMEMIQASEARMDDRQRKLWNMITIPPEKWHQSPYGETEGFWVVALIGRTAIWYNDIEHGFNRTKYGKYGEIVEYGCDIDALQTTIRYLIYQLDEDYRVGLDGV